ncbi:hypothetical protein Vadar_003262 [Vaccinium darrowii]|uniref:Uncharacterized protein n=1 Tax=Vaccinium darrowii TaxID=229202 RepID=A0ACB7WX77_9ERIC|nr:hypothetical protein Vadar_003262 [Vaccinium darrowii]
MEEVNLVEIYSLNAGLWKVSSRASDSFPPGYYLETPSAYLKGAIHWAAEPLRNRIDAVVLSFDLSDDVFKTISLPSDVASASDMKTAVVWGSLSLICEDTFDRANKSCSIWIMKEYGVVDSWYKYVKIDLTGGIKGVIGIRNNGHILLEGDKPRHWELSSYDPRSKEIKLLGINGTIGHFSVDAYKENLVLLNKTDVPVSRRGWSRKRKDRQRYTFTGNILNAHLLCTTQCRAQQTPSFPIFDDKKVPRLTDSENERSIKLALV